MNTVLFDMGGTLEDIWYDDQTIAAVTKKLNQMLCENGLHPGYTDVAFWNSVNSGVKAYKAWSEKNELEKKPEEIWPDYYLRDFAFDRAAVAQIAEQLADMWEVTYYHRELRPGVKETLQTLQDRGWKLGVISNTASLYSVFNVLEKYGIRSYFRDVTLSSVTGYRKPHPGIFEISLRQMQSKAADCVYVGDTVSRDIIGAKKAGFGKAVQIGSFLSAQKDAQLGDGAATPDHIITEIGQLLDVLGNPD